MQIVSYVLCFIGIVINLLVILVSCAATINYKLKINLKLVMILLVSSIFAFLVSMFLPYHYKIIFMLIIISGDCKLLFKQDIRECFCRALMLYLVLLVIDFLISFLVLLLANISSMSNYVLSLVQVPYTLLVSAIYYLLFKNKKVIKIYGRVVNIILNKYSDLTIIIVLYLMLCVSVLTYIHSINGSLNSFVVVFILISFFIFLFIVAIKFYYKNKTTIEEQKNLLSIMNEYEIILEKGRINRHEMLNNLLALKSFKNKASKDYEVLLNDIIKDYQSKKTNTYSNLYKLPSGVKGIVYYKMANIIDKDINFNSEISNQVYEYFDRLDAKLYFKVCKIIGILLDNAIEASMMTKKKLIFIEMFVNSENSITVLIENSTLHEVNINEISKKGFSTKGENRGYGLYLVNSIVKATNNLELIQYMFNGNFVTELKITL